MSRLTSPVLSTRKLSSTRRLVLVRSVSDAAILGTAFITGIVLCGNAAIANAFIFRLGGAADILVRFNQILLLAVIFLLWKLLRWGRERNELLRERNKIIVELNHTIRNACQTILLFADESNTSADPEIARASVVRIEQALDEYIPNAFVVEPPRQKTA